MKNGFLLLLSYVVLVGFACGTKYRNVISSDERLMINNNFYKQAESDSYSIDDVKLTDNTLSVTITANSCNDASWEVKLLDSDRVAESAPPQRYLKLYFKLQESGDEPCDKDKVSRTYSFNISSLKVKGYKNLRLNLQGYKEAIDYKY